MSRDQAVNEKLEAVLRKYVPHVPSGVPLPRETPLAELGVDSMQMIGLLVEVEKTFGLVIPDAALLPERIGSAGRLGALIEDLLKTPG